MVYDLLKIIPQYLTPKHALTSFAGSLANATTPWVKDYLISWFIQKYQVNMHEAIHEDPAAYACFNDFFIRHLKPECRPLASADIVVPVDGCVSEIGAIEADQIIQAKGRYYSVQELLACDPKRAQQFHQGRFATLYLSPKDYHRVHMPIGAELLSMTYVPGALFSVQPAAVRLIPGLFARNERLVVWFETAAGLMAMVLVGATIVGAIGTAWGGDVKRSKKSVHFDYQKTKNGKTLGQGEEMGYFKLGSTVVVLFANGDKVAWDERLKAGSALRLGEEMGRICG